VSVRWGLLATGGIADSFARDLALVPDASLVAVGSRTAESAERFGAKFDVAHRHGSYAELAEDSEVDAIYVATPHPGHHDATLLAISHGKAVLVEKPFAMDVAESSAMVEAARSAGTFLMEAMWTRFLPHIARVRAILDSGVLGEIVYVSAEHGQWFPLEASHRLFAFAHMVLGEPSAITARSTPAFTGVDATTSAIFEYASGAHAVVTTSLSAASNNPAAIYGTAARLEIDGWFYTPGGFTVTAHDGTVLERFDTPPAGRGMQHEAIEVGRCLDAGLLESPVMPLAETLAIMGTLDEIRRQIGLTY
jgi:predicted dehydrogenase